MLLKYTLKYIFVHAAAGVGPLIRVLYSMFLGQEQLQTCSAQDFHVLRTGN